MALQPEPGSCPKGSKSCQLCLFGVQIGPGRGGTPVPTLAVCPPQTAALGTGQQEAATRGCSAVPPKDMSLF